MVSPKTRAKVWVRVKPTVNFDSKSIVIDQERKAIEIHVPLEAKGGSVNNQKHNWIYKTDGILDRASQEDVYKTVAEEIVVKALHGFNGTLFCYGQTGAGKTYTMSGLNETFHDRGFIPRALSQIYKHINDSSEDQITVRISYLEIYNETMLDLLATMPNVRKSNDMLSITEDGQGINVKGLSIYLAASENDALQLLFEGETNRSITNHTLNAKSSRSHCIFTVYIERKSLVYSDAMSTVSKIHFVDLAGSERLSKTMSQGRAKQESMYINKSLTFLEQIVIALRETNREHVPFRQSKLTHYLKDSIGGNCVTHMITNIWGEVKHLEETVSSLRFSSLMMQIPSKPSVNELVDPHATIRKLEKEICSLKRELAVQNVLTNQHGIDYDPISEQQLCEIKSNVMQFLDGQQNEIEISSVRQIQEVFEAFKSIVKKTEKDVESRLKSKYTFIDKSDKVAIATAQKSGISITDDGELVGELDGQGISVGATQSASKSARSSVVSAKKRESRKSKSRERTSSAQKTGSPSHSTKVKDETSTPTFDKIHEIEIPGTPTDSKSVMDAETTRQPPLAPPDRKQIFEEFKNGPGAEINRIFIENKAILTTKNSSLAEVGRTVNNFKHQIDTLRTELNEIEMNHANKEILLDDDGLPIISEKEFNVLNNLKNCKESYKTNYIELQRIAAEVSYCQKAVNLCRHKLVGEYDAWYTKSFIGSNEIPAPLITNREGADENSSKVTFEIKDDHKNISEKYGAKNPDAAIYYSALHETQRRKTHHEALSKNRTVMFDNQRATGNNREKIHFPYIPLKN